MRYPLAMSSARNRYPVVLLICALVVSTPFIWMFWPTVFTAVFNSVGMDGGHLNVYKGDIIFFLGSMRSALEIYRSDHETFPKDIYGSDFYGRYFFESNIHRLRRGLRPGLPPEQHLWPSKKIRMEREKIYADSGQWIYINDPNSPNFGTFYIDCTHQDYDDHVWNTY